MSDSSLGLRLRRLLPSLRLQASRIARSEPAARGVGFVSLAELRRFSELVDTSYDHAAFRRRRWFDLDRGFGAALFVIVPTLAAAIYYEAIAADRFVSQSELVLRSASFSGTGIPSEIASPAGIASAGGLSIGGDRDAEAVATYLTSHDAVAAVNRVLDLRKVFARPEADRLASYPGLWRYDTNHALDRYYEDMVSVFYDPTVGIINLTVEAFRPEDARAISEALIGSAEQLVNRMDLRVRQDGIRAAEEQADSARVQVVAAQQKLTEFRLREQMVDPVKMSGVVIETVGQLLSQSIDLKARLSDLLKSAPNNQQASVLRNQIASLEEQIAVQQRKLAGSDGSLSPILAEYVQLSLHNEFANRIYTASLEQLEAVQAEAARQRTFVERVSGPTMVDHGTQPKRGMMVLLVFAVSLSVWSVLRFVIQDSRMHHGR